MKIVNVSNQIEDGYVNEMTKKYDHVDDSIWSIFYDIMDRMTTDNQYIHVYNHIIYVCCGDEF